MLILQLLTTAYITVIIQGEIVGREYWEGEGADKGGGNHYAKGDKSQTIIKIISNTFQIYLLPCVFKNFSSYVYIFTNFYISINSDYHSDTAQENKIPRKWKKLSLN